MEGSKEHCHHAQHASFSEGDALKIVSLLHIFQLTSRRNLPVYIRSSVPAMLTRCYRFHFRALSLSDPRVSLTVYSLNSFFMEKIGYSYFWIPNECIHFLVLLYFLCFIFHILELGLSFSNFYLVRIFLF